MPLVSEIINILQILLSFSDYMCREKVTITHGNIVYREPTSYLTECK